MPNALAFLAVFSWPLAVFLLFKFLPRAEAFAWSILGGYLLLPTRAGIDLPAVPPIDNVPPRPEAPLDRDPHDDSAKKFSGRCQKAHFLREDGRLIDVLGVEFDALECPPIPSLAPTTAILR